MGLPKILIEFFGKAVSAVTRSSRGIVALILKDDTPTAKSQEIKSIDDVLSTDWTPANLNYIKQTLKGTPSKVIIEVIPADSTDFNEGLKNLGNKRFNYLAIPSITSAQTEDIVTWIKEKRKDKKSYKAVLPNAKADCEGVINFTANGIKVGEDIFTTAEYTPRIAGIIAGLPFTRSATFYVLDEVDEIIEPVDPDAAVDAGELILINDGEKIKIGRGVNSLVTTTTTKTEDYKSIRIVEVMDMVSDDIRSTFEDGYVGKVNNIYDNQTLFITAVNGYFKELAGNEILDKNYDNQAEINVDAQRLAWEKIGVDTSEWDDQTVKETSFKRNVFLKGNVKIVDSMEDLDFNIFM